MFDQKIVGKIDAGADLDAADLRYLLSLEDEADITALFQKAYEVKLRHVGNKVYFRGIVELSNICEKNCSYCGIRSGNLNVDRYEMSEDEIVSAALWSHQQHYGSVVLQAGERTGPRFASMIEQVLRRIKEGSEGKLGVTLSLGEQEKETYRRWFEAGAHRYLLRIETSNPKLYRRLHPADHSFERRRQCLLELQEVGYQVGTGVMIGLPFQTIDDLVNDLLFFKAIDVDMIGMGPYIVHHDTPLASEMPDFERRKEAQLTLSLKMIAAARILLKDVNIASTTALQALKPDGREDGLLAGANIIMPNVTETKYRSSYQLYEDKPCVNENSAMCKGCLERRIASIGETIGYDEWGDSRHFKKRDAAPLA